MKIIEVKLAKRSYRIIIGSGVIKNLGRYIQRLNLGCDAYIITNALIKRKYARPLLSSLRRYNLDSAFKVIPDSEKSKSLRCCLGIIQDLAGFDRKKKVFVAAFGGGVVGDVGSFVASIYKRGVPYIQIPTTLLACVDSSIGGKTGVDLKFGKNLVGTFYQPRLVLSDLSFLKSLSPRQVRAGLAEVIKCAIIKDRDLFRYLERNHSRLLNLQMPVLEYIVSRCAQIKAAIISEDERETKGKRTVLNFGHTLGHAIEAAGDYQKYNHGEAVALGMILASQISYKLRLIDKTTLIRITDLIRAAGLPVSIKKGLSLGKILKAYYRDKKFIGGHNRLVLIKGIGKTIIRQGVPLDIIKDSLCGRMSPGIRPPRR